MLELLYRILGKEAPRPSKAIAHERLRLVLMHDRLDISPQVLEHLKNDLVRVISDYMVIDEQGAEVRLHREQGCVALVASIPVLRVKQAM